MLIAPPLLNEPLPTKVTRPVSPDSKPLSEPVIVAALLPLYALAVTAGDASVSSFCATFTLIALGVTTVE